MTTRFDILLTLSISHPYYSTPPADFEFVVTPETQQLLRNRKIIAKVRDGRLYLLSERDEDGTPLVPAAGQTIRIGLKLVNPYFGNFTDLDFTPGAVVLLYRNSAAPAALDAPQKVRIIGNIFSHTLTANTRPVTVTMFQSPSQVLETKTVTAENERLSLAFDLTNDPSGSYFVKEEFGITTTTSYYREAELLREGILGVVEILVAGDFATTPPDFTIPFNARQETLKYYLVTRKYSDAEIDQLQVSDTGFTDEERPQILFTKVAQANFTSADVPAALLGNGTTKIVLFKSQAAVARREKARRKIQLKLTDTLIQHLPQPAADQTTADMIIHLSKP